MTIASINGWLPITGGEIHSGHYCEWIKKNHRIVIRPTDRRKPRGSKTIWLYENNSLKGAGTRLEYADTYKQAVRIATTYMKRW